MIFHSSFEYGYLLLPVVGFVIGLLGSVLGGGGGFFFIPVLTVLFGVPAQVSVATSLAASLPICIAGSYGHYRNKNVDLPMGLTFSAFGILGAIAGAGLTSIMTTRQLKVSFGVYAILMAIYMIISRWREKKSEINREPLPEVKKHIRLTRGGFFGFTSGIITGTFGTSGTAPVQAAMFAMRMPFKIVLGTSLIVSTVNNFSALGGHFLLGKIDLTLVYFLTSGAIIGALVGPRFLAGIKIGRAEGPLRFWYAVGMILFGLLMIVTGE